MGLKKISQLLSEKPAAIREASCYQRNTHFAFCSSWFQYLLKLAVTTLALSSSLRSVRSDISRAFFQPFQMRLGGGRGGGVEEEGVNVQNALHLCRWSYPLNHHQVIWEGKVAPCSGHGSLCVCVCVCVRVCVCVVCVCACVHVCVHALLRCLVVSVWTHVGV